MKSKEKDCWKWGRLMIKLLDEMKERNLFDEFKVIDWEVIPDFSGSADNMFVHLICNKKTDKVVLLEDKKKDLFSNIREEMKNYGFSKLAVESIDFNIVSFEEINEGGGRFLYFR